MSIERMHAARSDAAAGPRPLFIEQPGARAADPAQELRESLAAPAPFIPPKFFYDRLGSALFSAICELPEYYPTRTEAGIFDQFADAIAQAVGPGATLIDLGAGDCAKAASLFERLRPAQYVAVDISAEFVRDALECLQRQFTWLPMVGLGVDFSGGLALPDAVRAQRRLFFYPGSSIGNFTPEQAVDFLSGLRRLAAADGGLLIGVDLAKPREIVEPAYADALGVTAAFNLNVLSQVNRLIGSDFRLEDWEHVALLNEDAGRIEMHLQARRDLLVRWPGGSLSRRAGERIHTENSYKYRQDDFERLLARAGFLVDRCWCDAQGWFAVIHARPASGATQERA